MKYQRFDNALLRKYLFFTMVCLTLDTCVWLELLKVDFNNEDNLFEEMCFWIEKKHLIHVVPENIVKEWNRNKSETQSNIIGHFEKSLSFFKHNTELNTTNHSSVIRDSVQKRIARIDLIFDTFSEKALQTPEIIQLAAIKNLDTLAPNHKSDSFRDTVNILTLTHHLASNAYDIAYFSTLNYKDFSADAANKDTVHTHLEEDFKKVNLIYSYFGEKEGFGKRLFYSLRKTHSLPSFEIYLKEKTKLEYDRILSEKMEVSSDEIENPDLDYLENIRYIDLILVKKTPTAFELEIMKSLIGRHDSYKQYFLKTIGTDGLV